MRRPELDGVNGESAMNRGGDEGQVIAARNGVIAQLSIVDELSGL